MGACSLLSLLSVRTFQSAGHGCETRFPKEFCALLRKRSLRVRLQLVSQEIARIQRKGVGSDVVANFYNAAMSECRPRLVLQLCLQAYVEM